MLGTHLYCNDPKIVIIFHKHLEHKMHIKFSIIKKYCMLFRKFAEHHVHFKFKLETNLCKKLNKTEHCTLHILAELPSILGERPSKLLYSQTAYQTRHWRSIRHRCQTVRKIWPTPIRCICCVVAHTHHTWPHM